MDDIVKAAMAKWPNVPDCYGWLGLDARGRWWMRDDQAQAAGPYAGPGSSVASKGSMLRHDKLIEFIQRNYAKDAEGQWYFQNGPQRVYVELEVAPWVWRVDAGYHISTVGGQPAQYQACLMDEEGRLFLETDLGLGLVHTQDMLQAASAIESGLWKPVDCVAAELPRRYGYVLSPKVRQTQTKSD